MADIYDDSALAKALVHEASTAALGTLDAEGWPFVSHVTVAIAANGEPLLLLSRLAVHTRNLERDDRASLLFVRRAGPGSEALAAERLSVMGTIFRDFDPESRKRFLARHPDAARYAGFTDFGIYRFRMRSAHLVAGFGRIAEIAISDLVGLQED